jgi:hypothetical protein
VSTNVDMIYCIILNVLYAIGEHDDVRPVLVLFSNDTNDNGDGVIGSTYPRCIQFALDNGWSVEVCVVSNFDLPWIIIMALFCGLDMGELSSKCSLSLS